MSQSVKWRGPVNMQSDVRWSIYFQWAQRCPTGLICSMSALIPFVCSTPTRNAACSRCAKCVCCRAASFLSMTRRAPHSAAAGAQLVLVGDLAASIQHFNAEARKRYAFLAYPPERPLLEPGRLFLSEEGFFTQAKAFARLVFPPSASAVRSESRNLFKNCNERASGGGGRSAGSRWTAPLPPLAINRHAADPVAALRAYLSESGHRTLVVCDSAGRRETMLQLFAAHGL